MHTQSMGEVQHRLYLEIVTNDSFAVAVLDSLEQVGHDILVLIFTKRPVTLHGSLRRASIYEFEYKVQISLPLKYVRMPITLGYLNVSVISISRCK